MINKKKKIAMYIVMALITLIIVFPFIWMVLLSFKLTQILCQIPWHYQRVLT